MKIHRACHYEELFVKSNGDVFPCCRVWNIPSLKIGNITDSDILRKIEEFSPIECSCTKYKLKRPNGSDNLECEFLNIELSLHCQGKCVMCCVGAPDYQEKYDLYEAVYRFVHHIPKSKKSLVIYVQGGEILVQPKSMEILERLRNDLPGSCFWLCTNGNGTEKMWKRAVGLFDRFTISVYAFQQETYESVSGLRLNKTIEFAESLVRNHGKPLNLKYLATPISIHEVALFMKWAVILQPSNIQIVDSGIVQYIRDSRDNYWKKIMTATGRKVREILSASDRCALRESGTAVLIDPYFLDAFGVDKKFINKQKLDGIVEPHPNSK